MLSLSSISAVLYLSTTLGYFTMVLKRCTCPNRRVFRSNKGDEELSDVGINETNGYFEEMDMNGKAMVGQFNFVTNALCFLLLLANAVNFGLLALDSDDVIFSTLKLREIILKDYNEDEKRNFEVASDFLMRLPFSLAFSFSLIWLSVVQQSMEATIKPNIEISRFGIRWFSFFVFAFIVGFYTSLAHFRSTSDLSTSSTKDLQKFLFHFLIYVYGLSFFISLFFLCTLHRSSLSVIKKLTLFISTLIFLELLSMVFFSDSQILKLFQVSQLDDNDSSGKVTIHELNLLFSLVLELQASLIFIYLLLCSSLSSYGSLYSIGLSRLDVIAEGESLRTKLLAEQEVNGEYGSLEDDNNRLQRKMRRKETTEERGFYPPPDDDDDGLEA